MTLRDTLTEQVLESSKWERRQVGYPELERRRSVWIEKFAQVFVGAQSISVPARHLKLVAFDEWPVTSGELARQYLRNVYAGVRTRPPSPRARGFGWQAPIMANPVRHRALGYVDITSAYWQLVSCFAPDDLVLGDEIVPGKARWLTVEEVEADRRLRHCIHGTIFSNRIAFYNYGKLVVVPKTSVYSNPTLAAHCMQVLHAVCGILSRDIGVWAWMTDAAIVDADDIEPVMRYMEREWALQAKLKALGSGAVVSATTYCVGDKMSRDLLNGTTDLSCAEPRTFTNLRRVPRRQLQTVRRRVAV